MATIRALLVLVQLAVPSMPAAAGLADPDPRWGVAGFADVGFIPSAVFPEPDGTLWVVGRDLDTGVGRLAHIDADGTVAESLQFGDDVPTGVISRVGRTLDGFAVLTYSIDDDTNLLFEIDLAGGLDPRFGIIELAAAGSSVQVGYGFLVMGNRVLVTTLDWSEEASVAEIHAFGPDGTLDPSFGVGGVLEFEAAGSAFAAEILPAASGISVVLVDQHAANTMVHLVEVSSSGVVGERSSVTVANQFEDVEGVRRPDGSVVLARTAFGDDTVSSYFEVITFAGSEGHAVLVPGLVGSEDAIVAADRDGATGVFLSDQLLHADTGEVTRIAGPRVRAAGTDWLTGSVYLGLFDGRIQRSAPDGSGRFTDDDGSVHEGNIAELASSEITRGCNPPLATWFCPDDTITRGEMAAFLARALDLPAGEASFTDVAGSVFSADIAALAASGITRGCAPDRFCPDDSVTRGQMAAFLTRALGLSPGPDAFTDDDGTVFEADIDALAAAGITKGCTPDSFCPDEPVTRAQMASFLVRAGFAD